MASQLAQLERMDFFVRAKVTVRAKGARVNSVFLVQLRKKNGR
jgi:hypothetical protein